MSLLFYSNEDDREYEIDVDLIWREDSSFYQINGIYEKGLNIEKSLDEFCLSDRVQIKQICSLALEDHYFGEYEKMPKHITIDEKY